MVYLKKNLRKKKKKKTHHTLRPLSQIFWTLTTPTSSSTPRFIFILTFYPCFSPFNPTPSFHSSPFLPPALVSREDEAAPIHWELNGLSGDSYQSQPFHTGAQFFVFLLSVLLSNHLTALQQKKKIMQYEVFWNVFHFFTAIRYTFLWWFLQRSPLRPCALLSGRVTWSPV